MSNAVQGLLAACGTDSVQAILDARGVDYGVFRSQASASQELKSVMQKRLDRNIRYTGLDGADRAVIDETLNMLCNKLSRIVNGDPLFPDSWNDVAGYAKLVPIHTAKLEGKDND